MSHNQSPEIGPELPLSLKKDLCSDIEQRGSIRAFHGYEGSKEQKLSKFLNKQPELYGCRGGLKRKKIGFFWCIGGTKKTLNSTQVFVSD